MQTIEIYTDGSYLDDTKSGGYAAFIPDQVRIISGACLNTTNNRMEMMAVIRGLACLTEPHHVILYCDSKYVVDALRKGWLDGWIRRGWRRADGGPVKNRDQWEQLHQLRQYHHIEAVWVKGHSGVPGNEVCDVISRHMATHPQDYLIPVS